MSASSYSSLLHDAMRESRSPEAKWVELPSHRLAAEAVARWLDERDGTDSFRVSGANGVGKSRWFEQFLNHRKEAERSAAKRTRWIVARFGRGEPVQADHLIRQWSESLSQWVERPSRYAQASEARNWLDLALRTLQAEGCEVVRVIESDRSRLQEDPQADSLTRGILWLAREPFRGSHARDRSFVLPVWSHDELAYVLSRTYPAREWPDTIVTDIWSKSSGRARRALKIAAAIAGKPVEYDRKAYGT
jgi:hypothetical protein